MNNYRKSSINHPSGLFILNTFKRGIFERGRISFIKTMISALHKKL